MGAIRRMVPLSAIAFGLLVSAMGLAVVGAPTVAGAAGSTSVATTTMTFVELSLHAAVGRDAGKASRTLVTTIWYPARASGSGAAAGNGPYPLIVFAHGLEPRHRSTSNC